MATEPEQSPEFAEALSAMKRRRMRNRAEWTAYWEMRDEETKDSFFNRLVYRVRRINDGPVTWFRENIVEPMHDKHKMPYYHRKISRVPEIDECGVNNKLCVLEAEEQYRLDKLVDAHIKQILFKRMQKCVRHQGKQNMFKCIQPLEDYTTADYNFFVKYCELPGEGSVVHAYMKQKHRLIWERRHPEIMDERKRAYEEHLEKMREGKYDTSFWNKFALYLKKKDYPPGQFYSHHYMPKFPGEGDEAISTDPRYYKKLYDEPEFDKANYPQKWNEFARLDKEQRDAASGGVGNGNGAGGNGNGGNGNGGNGNGKGNGGNGGNGENGNGD